MRSFERQKISPARIHSPKDSGDFRLLSSLEVHSSEDSNLLFLASPRTSRENDGEMDRINITPDKRSRKKDN